MIHPDIRDACTANFAKTANRASQNQGGKPFSMSAGYRIRRLAWKCISSDFLFLAQETQTNISLLPEHRAKIVSAVRSPTKKSFSIITRKITFTFRKKWV